MATHDSSSTSTSGVAPGAGSGAFVRLGWMVGGTLMLLIAGFTILSEPPWTFGARDAVFWSGALLALAFRYVDVARFKGQTSNGRPATMTDYRRYAVGLIAIATVGWTLAQALHV